MKTKKNMHTEFYEEVSGIINFWYPYHRRNVHNLVLKIVFVVLLAFCIFLLAMIGVKFQ